MEISSLIGDVSLFLFSLASLFYVLRLSQRQSTDYALIESSLNDAEISKDTSDVIATTALLNEDPVPMGFWIQEFIKTAMAMLQLILLVGAVVDRHVSTPVSDDILGFTLLYALIFSWVNCCQFVISRST